MTTGALSTLRARVKISVPIALLTLFTLGLAACVGPSAPGPKTQIGAVTGATAGGLLGRAAGGDTRSVLAGMLVGGLVGGAVGNALDNADREYAWRNAHHALESTPSGTTSEWRNPDSGHSVSITPRRTYQTASDSYCREFTQTINVGGRVEEGYGTACRQPDGSWKIVQ
jgi:surface antigen